MCLRFEATSVSLSDEALTFYLMATTLRLITTPLTGSHSDLWRHLIKRSQHDEIKATPKWLIELELIGWDSYFIVSGGNHRCPVVLMPSNIYLCPTLTVLVCVLPSFPMGMSERLKFTAK